MTTSVSLQDCARESASKHITVIGDLMLDRYWYGTTTRISPEAPVPVVNISKDEQRPGGAANVALNLVALGCKVTLIGVTGKDEAGQNLKELLVQAGVDCHFVVSLQILTTTKLRILSQQQQLLRADFEKTGLLDSSLHQQLQQLAQDYIPHSDAVILSDYAKGCMRPAIPFIDIARSYQIPIMVDPKSNDWSLYKGASALTPNSKEFLLAHPHLTTTSDFDSEPVQALAQSCLDTYNLYALLITRSAEGMTLFEQDKPKCHLPTQAREVFDVTGAGDTVIAMLGLGVALGYSYQQAAQLANMAAAKVIAKVGTSPVYWDELQH